MHMRFVRMKIKEDKSWTAQQFYRERVLPQLEATEGCLFAGFLQGTIHAGDCMSMTVWDHAASAAEYEKSGLFDRLLDESDEMLQEAQEWSADVPGSEGAVVFSGMEPEVQAGTIAGAADEEVLDQAGSGRVFVRLVSVRLRPGAFEEFARRYEDEIRPALVDVPGCLDAFAVEGADDSNNVLSVTFWAREDDAVRYGLSGEYERLTQRLSDTFSDLYHWNPMLSDGANSGTGIGRRSPDVDGYHLVVGGRLKSTSS